jgi:hypothetical protein
MKNSAFPGPHRLNSAACRASASRFPEIMGRALQDLMI